MTSPAIEIESLLGPAADPVAAGTTMRQIAIANATEQATEWFQALWESKTELEQSDPAILGGLFRAIHTSILNSEDPAATIRPINPTLVFGILERLPESTPNRHLLMHLMTLARSGDHLHILTQMLVKFPPAGWMSVGQVLSPLLQHSDWEVSDFFPDVLEALAHPSVASPVLDVANFLTRTGRVETHPAASRIENLLRLLDAVVQKLERFESNPTEFGNDVETIQSVLGEAVALAVSLCDALGLIGDDRAKGKLHQAMQIKHRRVQSEAAGALTRLGDEAGQEHLLGLAAEPAARRRVLQYAEELDLADAIDEDYTTPQALAEADVAVWLCQPQNMGVPPTEISVIDSKRMLWPSYSTPIDCFLVRFEFDFGDTQYSNVAIAGPTVHAFAADLAELPSNDIYAAYAGWHAEHKDIFAITEDHWNAAQKRMVSPLVEYLRREGYESIQPRILGFLLDEHAIVCEATREDRECVVVTDGLETIDQTTVGRPRPLGTQEMWYIYLGRKMLRTFNG